MATEYFGINYFPLSTNFFEKDLQELLDAKFGIKGPYTVIKLLCKIYTDGYYILWGEDQCLILARKLGKEFSPNDVEQIVNLLLERGFFDKKSYEKHQILTSVALQEVWMEATCRRKRDLTKLPYLLIDISPDKQEHIKPENVDNQSTQLQLNLENADISEQNADISEQSKGKESKKKNNPPSIPPLKSMEDDNTVLPAPPEYALNKKTHNYDGLLETLRRIKVTDIGEIKAILRLSNYGEMHKPLWKILAVTHWEKIDRKSVV